MPYLRYYHSEQVPIEQKRLIAQKLIEITLRTFRLRNEDRSRINIQFVTRPAGSDVGCCPPGSAAHAECTLEIMAHDLTEGKKSAFTAEASAMLARSIPVKQESLISRFFGRFSCSPARIAMQFTELNPAVSDPFVADTERIAA
jgi:hypothetical protein